MYVGANRKSRTLKIIDKALNELKLQLTAAGTGLHSS
jgi:hypothetical protein